MKIILFLLALVIAIGSVSAVHDTLLDACKEPYTPSGSPDPEVCTDMIETEGFEGLDKGIRKDILLYTFSQGYDVYQKHNLVKAWNMNINFTEGAPEELTPYSEDCGFSKQSIDCIHGGWMDLFTVMPSFEEGGIYINKTGYAQTGYYYELWKPDNWHSSDGSYKENCGSYPVDSASFTEVGGNICDIKFSFADESTIKFESDDPTKEELTKRKVFEKNSTGWDNRLWDYDVSDDTDFKATLNIKNIITANYVKWRTETGSCCEGHMSCNDDGDCHWVCTKHTHYYYCDSSGSKDVDYEKEIPSRVISAKLYNAPEPTNRMTVIINPDKSPDVVLTTDADDYELKFGHATLNRKSTGYNISWSYPPYNILRLGKIEEHDLGGDDLKLMKTTDQNSVKFHTTERNIGVCGLTYYFPFSTKGEKCRKDVTIHVPEIIVKTDETVYEKEDTIKVYVDVKKFEEEVTGDVVISYCDIHKTASIDGGTAEAEFEAERGCSEVSAVYIDYSTEYKDTKKVNVKEDYTLMWSVAIFFGFMILFWRVGYEVYRRARI